jgi:hypothetical protein
MAAQLQVAGAQQRPRPCHRSGLATGAGDAPGVGRTRGELRAKGVVDVEHAVTDALEVEQPRLGCAVTFHVAMEVEMVTRQVREQRRVKAQRLDAMLHECMRRDLDRGRTGAGRAETRQLALHPHRIRRRQLAGLERPAYGGTQCSKVSAAQSAVVQRLREQPRAGGLAVGAGDADDIEGTGRFIEEAAGQLARAR